MQEARSRASSAPLRFGEFLRDRQLLDDEQWLAVLAAHWSAPRRRRLGDTILAEGLLTTYQLEAAARAFHEDQVDQQDQPALALEEAEVITSPLVRMDPVEAASTSLATPE